MFTWHIATVCERLDLPVPLVSRFYRMSKFGPKEYQHKSGRHLGKSSVQEIRVTYFSFFGFLATQNEGMLSSNFLGPAVNLRREAICQDPIAGL